MALPPVSIRVLALVGVLALAGLAAWALRGDGLSSGAARPESPGAAKGAPQAMGKGAPQAMGKGAPPGGVAVEIARAELSPLAETVRADGTLRSD